MDVQQSVQIGKFTPHPGTIPTGPDLNSLVKEYAVNKAKADALTARNAEIAEALEKSATFKDGSNTGHLSAGGHKLTITRKYNIKWNSEKLETARVKLTDELFFKVFGWEFKPKGKRELDTFLDTTSPDFRVAILAAMETSPGKPTVKMEALQ